MLAGADLRAQKGFGVLKILSDGAACGCRIPPCDELINVLMMGTMLLKAADEGKNAVTSLGEGVIHHAHGALDGCVVGGLGDGVVEFDLCAHELFGIVNRGSHAGEGGAHSFAVGGRGAAGGEGRGGGFENLAEFVELEIFNFLQQKHPAEMPANHAAEAGLQVGSVAGTRLEQAEKYESLECFAQRSAADAQHLREAWLRGQTAATAQLSAPHQRFKPVSDHLYDGIAPGWSPLGGVRFKVYYFV